MRGQLSLEALAIFGIGIAFLAFLFPTLAMIKSAGENVQKLASVRLAFGQLAAGCDAARITNEQKKVSLLSLENFTISEQNGVLGVTLENKTTSVNSSCKFQHQQLDIAEGKNQLTIEPNGDVHG